MVDEIVVKVPKEISDDFTTFYPELRIATKVPTAGQRHSALSVAP